MTLSEQERRCIELACRDLKKCYGCNWSIQQYLDGLNLPKPTPEVTVGNGERTAAIEVKRLQVIQRIKSTLQASYQTRSSLCPLVADPTISIPP